ncbi:MAG: dihydroorotase [Bacteroidia bacterium]|nr:dihydroorotase [Bacteroidia bacterium]
MELILRSARITDSRSVLSGKITDILIENGVITDIRKGIRSSTARVIESEHLHVSAGWFDMQVNFCDPGMEYKEDIRSGCRAAAAGGFTGVLLMPSTQPSISSKAQVEYVLNKSEKEIVEIVPAGTLSELQEGKDLAEMFDMYQSGARAFTDDLCAVKDAGLMNRAIQYTNNFGGLILAYCDDPAISGDGKMNEGVESTKLGLKGIPGLAEEIMVARNIFLAEYNNARIHLCGISTAKSVQMIREAKKKKIKVTASANCANLFFNDSALREFDTNLKVKPPLRNQADQEALLKGVADGTIDVIASDHRPEDVENKVVEFDHAAFGMSSIETMFAMANMSRGRMSLEKLIEKFSVNPRKLLGLPIPQIKKGEKANLTVFDPTLQNTIQATDFKSKSKNNPLIAKTMQGKVLGIVHKNKFQGN